MKRRIPALAGLALVGLALAGCTSGPPAAGGDDDGITIAFLMPCSTCADRFESKDKPYFIDAVHAIDPDIEVIANNAEGDAANQLKQAEAALTNGADVIVVSPYTAEAGAAIVEKANAAGAKVVAYDGAIEGAAPDAYVAFQNDAVGALQGQFLLDNLGEGSTVAMINGDITSAPGRDFKAGAHSVLDPAFDSGTLVLGYESDTAGFDPATGQRSMEQALTDLGDDVQGVIAPNDGLAGAVITALTARGLNGKVLVTGSDATDAALTSIILGDQSMTVYKSIQAEAEAAAKIAVALARGEDISDLVTTTVNNGTADIPSLILDAQVVTAENMADTVIKDGYTTKEAVCVGAAEAKCPF